MPYGDLTGSRAGRGWSSGGGYGAAHGSGTTRVRARARNNPKAFRAKFPGECAECHHPIKAGQMIRRRAHTSKLYRHVSCFSVENVQEV